MKDGPISSFLRLSPQARAKGAGPEAPAASRPLHLPVLTEVIPIQETVPGALMVLPDEPAAAEPPRPLFEGRAVPDWLLKRDEPAAPARAAIAPLPAAAMPVPGGTMPVSSGLAHDGAAPPTTPSGFGASWWMSDDEAPAVSASAPPPPQPFFPTPVPEPVPAPPPVPEPVPQFVLNEAQLVRSVMSDLDQQVSLMFEHRMREVMVPAFARATDALMNDLRFELALQMREMVARAVSMALARQRLGPESARD